MREDRRHVHTVMPLFSALAILGVIPALSVLYREFLDANWPRVSVVETAVISLSAAGIFFVITAFMPAIASSRLHLPTTALAAVGGFLCSLPVRDATRRVLPALAFSAAWTALVFTPVAIIVFFPASVGIAASDGPLDAGGALPVHVTVGASALVILMLGRSLPSVDRSHHRPRSWTILIAGALLWFGWTVGLVGLELAFDDTTARIVASSVAGPIFGAIGWLVIQRIRQATTTAQGFVAGLLCGLVAVTPGSAFLEPLWAAVISAIAGIAAAMFTFTRSGKDGKAAWFFVGAHLLSAVYGLVLLGLFGTGYGFIFIGQMTTLQIQITSVFVVTIWTGVVTLALWPLARGLTYRVPWRERPWTR